MKAIQQRMKEQNTEITRRGPSQVLKIEPKRAPLSEIPLPFFDKLPGIIRAENIEKYFDGLICLSTIYDWNQKRNAHRIPRGLIMKIGGRLAINTEVLKHWIVASNS